MQPEVMDVELIKREYGKDLVFYGGMGSQSTIPLGTVKDVLDEAKRRIEILGHNGGYIFGPAGAIPAEAKIENVMAMVEFAMNGYEI
jgi:uroporphyrinogen decarboxylase